LRATKSKNLPLQLQLQLQLFVFAVILSAAKDPGTLPTTHTVRTFPPSSAVVVAFLIPDP
jgi:hypothetical protein